ncbi:hypothetical protein OBBRIDRAFT_888734 [Obba rivulosa]|uniref:Uncharacterized protein n=1 Tax=Obba rivulosa TaxID=1052685 RepID=A0A8E2DJD8_9APHY|nr:hypothetical protein OBBRIDRAFT_888734 [Obba rivulosa]
MAGREAAALGGSINNTNFAGCYPATEAVATRRWLFGIKRASDCRLPHQPAPLPQWRLLARCLHDAAKVLARSGSTTNDVDRLKVGLATCLTTLNPALATFLKKFSLAALLNELFGDTPQQLSSGDATARQDYHMVRAGRSGTLRVSVRSKTKSRLNQE